MPNGRRRHSGAGAAAGRRCDRRSGAAWRAHRRRHALLLLNAGEEDVEFTLPTTPGRLAAHVRHACRGRHRRRGLARCAMAAAPTTWWADRWPFSGCRAPNDPPGAVEAWTDAWGRRRVTPAGAQGDAGAMGLEAGVRSARRAVRIMRRGDRLPSGGELVLEDGSELGAVRTIPREVPYGYHRHRAAPRSCCCFAPPRCPLPSGWRTRGLGRAAVCRPLADELGDG